ncbi:MAG: PIG-L family deacetylase [Bacteroidetes bacterium]|nr:PIG-L family deacetylase [Bacteroidota bacterium]
MNKLPNKFFLYTLLIIITVFSINNAQPLKVNNAAEIKLAIDKLGVLGSVLYIGAHPDDENTGLIAFLSKSKKYRTAYLSLTRGDGGQNLIGAEKGNEIGIIRTQELLQARARDGGEQFFTRAIDFGYSKTEEEALRIWGKEEILGDVVWVIRKFKPDVIITRFPPGGNGGHGHHTASASLAVEAFTAAADSTKFKDQLQYVLPWQAKKLFWNNWRPSPEETKGLLAFDIGVFNPMLGKSYTEIAAESRSMHKSQGFGATPSRGTRMEYLQQFLGDKKEKNLFDGSSQSWTRIKGGLIIDQKIDSIKKSFDSGNPGASINLLVNLKKEIDGLENNYWIDIKRKELLSIIQSCAGLWIEAISEDYSAPANEKVKIITTVINRSDNKFKIKKISYASISSDSTFEKELISNIPYTIEKVIKIPDGYPVSQPYWLEEKSSEGLFKVSDKSLLGLAENYSSLPVKVSLIYNGVELEYEIPLLYKWNDRVGGELYRPFEIRPTVTVNTNDKVAVFPDESSKEIILKLKNNTGAINGELHLHVDKNWKITPDVVPFHFEQKYDEKLITVNVKAPAESGESVMKIKINAGAEIYNKALVEISYPHIKRQVYFPDSEIQLVKLNIKRGNMSIGYIMGSGDEIPECLKNLGYDVTLLSDELLETGDLTRYGAIITGIRAYNTRERLKYSQQKLLEYVKNGGTFIVQYNVSFGLQVDNFGPYPIEIGRDRITEEKSKVTFLNTKHQLLNFPNKITEEDFNGWVQERGLYFADKWDSKYESAYSGHDNNEKDLYGGTLFTRFGKGVFIYTGYSWFRQLPAGIPGAYKIFVNMIEAGNYDGQLSNK